MSLLKIELLKNEEKHYKYLKPSYPLNKNVICNKNVPIQTKNLKQTFVISIWFPFIIFF